MNRLRELRAERGITQSQLAEHLQTNYQTISDYERGKYFPDISVLKRLAIYFETSIDYLLGITDLRSPYLAADERRFTPAEIELVELFRHLDEKRRERLLGYAQGLREVFLTP